MENKPGSEAGKTALAIGLLIVMLLVVYWFVIRPMTATKTASSKATTATTPAGAIDSAKTAANASSSATNAEKSEIETLAGAGGGSETAKSKQGPTTGPPAPGTAPFVPEKHAELAPDDYLNHQIQPNYIDATVETREYAKSPVARDSDKAFAGTAYFTNIQVPPTTYQIKNPFTPLVEMSPKQSSASQTENQSSGTSGGGDIFKWPNTYITGPLPGNGGMSEIEGPNGITLPGSTETPTGPPDENTLWILGGEVVLRGVALSERGASALLEMGPEGERKVVRVRTMQLMEGRYQVADIRENSVVIIDTTRGKSFTLDLNIRRELSA